MSLTLAAGHQAWAHGGEDHGAGAATSPAPGATSFSVAALSEQFELLLRFQPLKKGEPAHLQLFVSDYASNAAVDSAQLTLTVPEAPYEKFTATRQAPGVYLVEGRFPANQKYSLTVNIVAGEQADLLLLEGIEVGKELPAAAGPAAATGWLSGWKLWLLIAGAFLAGVLLTVVLLRRRGPQNSLAYENPA
ncbi:hypothetical protein [Hymenobacter latericus]|uniref:hypothetical protein n=1 Tax=Hymenobacter sp. YIM 151858-1 TaxID=2987688 RepID=UPI002227D6F9|nr:hypothetical protein [Hymenobacter sp. YIM 151858-1]UYZ61172.1 hypothetical protein OIS50_19575 [Hymenobacter sp. YIM 151858-1]